MQKKIITRNRDLDKLIKEYEDKGWMITMTNSHHLKWCPPYATKNIVISSINMKDYHSLANTKKQLERCSDHRFQ